ncbi:unnamed protein product [Tenebrio molitor]|nr:unnamed protein product [Tenebrio molitor]
MFRNCSLRYPKNQILPTKTTLHLVSDFQVLIKALTLQEFVFRITQKKWNFSFDFGDSS